MVLGTGWLLHKHSLKHRVAPTHHTGAWPGSLQWAAEATLPSWVVCELFLIVDCCVTDGSLLKGLRAEL